MHELLPAAERVAALLKARSDTVSIAESSAGGLIAASLLAVPGASAYFRGGAVVYTREAKAALLAFAHADFDADRPATPTHARLLAERCAAKLETVWAVGETGATGPTGNRYGDAAGHAYLAVAGPVPRGVTVETASADRAANMFVFARAGLELLESALKEASDHPSV